MIQLLANAIVVGSACSSSGGLEFHECGAVIGVGEDGVDVESP
jgi:hypothetical protein